MPISQHEIDVFAAQIRAQQSEIEKLKTQLSQTNGKINAVANAAVNSSTPNLINNSDFSFSDSGLLSFTFTDADKSLAYWYRLTNNLTSQITESVLATASANQLIYDATYGATPPTASWWNKTEGVVVWRKDDAILTPLPKNYALAGETLYVRLSARLDNRTPVEGDNNNPLPIDARIRCSIWENLATAKYAEGSAMTVPTLTLSPTASAGAYTRHYIIVAVDQFFNRASTPDTTITIDVVSGVKDLNKFVTVTWTEVKGASQYFVYRSDNGTDWYQIGTRPSGNPRLDDFGGMTIMVTAPTPSEKFKAQYISPKLNFGDGFTDVSARLKIPATYPFLATSSGKQWLRIDCTDKQGNVISLDTAQISLDRILLSTSAGRWSPSAADNNATNGVEVTDPPPPYVPDPYYDPYNNGNGYNYQGYGNY